MHEQCLRNAHWEMTQEAARQRDRADEKTEALRLAQRRLSLVQACVGPRGSTIPSERVVEALTKRLDGLPTEPCYRGGV